MNMATQWSRSFVTLSAMASILLLVGGCGNAAPMNQDDTAANVRKTTASGAYAAQQAVTVTDLAGNTVEFTEVPQRIVTFSAGDMSIVQALGGTVVGRPSIKGDVPAEARDIAEIGTTNAINLEKVAALQPDLIVAHRQLNAKDIPALKQLGAKILLTGAASLEENNASIEMIGKVLNKTNEAEALVQRINDKVAELAGQSNGGEVRSLIVFGLPSNWMVALPDSLSGSLLDAVGGFNIAKDYPQLERFPQYAQLNIERIVEADPQVVFLITPGPQEIAEKSFKAEMSKNPSWSHIAAVKQGHFIVLPNTLFGSNPGAKIIDSLDYLHNELQKISAK